MKISNKIKILVNIFVKFVVRGFDFGCFLVEKW